MQSLAERIKTFNEATGGAPTNINAGGPLTGAAVQALLLGGAGYGVGNLGARAYNWATGNELDPHRTGMLAGGVAGAVPVAAHAPALARNFQLSRALPASALGERLRTMNLPSADFAWSKRPAPDKRYWDNVDPEISNAVQSHIDNNNWDDPNIPGRVRAVGNAWRDEANAKSGALSAQYGAAGQVSGYDTFLPPDSSAMGFPAHYSIAQIENDPYLSPVDKAKAVSVIDEASGGRSGLVGWDDIARAGVGAGIGYAAASLFGKVLSGVFGGLDRGTQKKIQASGALAGLLMNTGVIKSGSHMNKTAALKQAFKRGFCSKLAELGIAPSTFTKAAEGVGNIIGPIAAAVPAVGKGLVAAGLVGAPAAAGWMMGTTKRTNKADIDYLTQLALLEDYKRGVDLLNRERDKTKSAAALNMPKAKAPVVPGPAKTISTTKQNIDKANDAVEKNRQQGLGAMPGGVKPVTPVGALPSVPGTV